MQIKKFVLPAILCLVFIHSNAQTRQQVHSKSIITTKKVLMNHEGEKDSLIIPVVSEKYPALKEALSDKNLFFGDALDSVVKNYETEGRGITGMTFEVTFENKDVISLKIFYETMGAYPDSEWKYLTLNVHTGKPYPISNEINQAGLNWILKTYKANLKRSVKADQRDRKKSDPDYKSDPETYNGVYRQLNEDIDNISFKDMFAAYVFTKRGVMFTTLTTVPHFARPLEPDREWLIPYNKLKIYKAPGATILK